MIPSLSGIARSSRRIFRGSRRRKSDTRSPKAIIGLGLMRWFTPGLTVSGAIAAVFAALTGHIHLPSLDLFRGAETPVVLDPMLATVPTNQRTTREISLGSVVPVSLNPPGQPRPELSHAGPLKSNTSMRIASFNIQVFGETKAAKADVMEQLARIFLLFDVIAVQEIKGDPRIPTHTLLNAISRAGGRYQAVYSQPLGRTTQTECYAFFWDQQRIDLIPESQYVVNDAGDLMHREPMVASFQTRVQPADAQRPFRFTIINAHTDPDLVRGAGMDNELNVLDDVFVSVRDYEYQMTGEDDYLLVGDLNVDVKGLSELGRIPNVVSLIGDAPTNTARTKTYDHLLLDRAVTTEFTGRAGVLDFKRDLQVNDAQAKQISDHLPIWAEFSVYETPRPIQQALAPSTSLMR